jgi:phenol 2-monooxygenase
VQFHLNGFRPGDPGVADDDDALSPVTPMRELPASVDVLIVGSGPTGLTVAAQLSALDGLSVCLVEQKPGPLQVGQADGIACRTMEMFEAFGFADRVLKESYWVNETVFWRPDPEHPRHIRRSDRIQDVEDGLSEMPHVILNQARVHDFFLDLMRRSSNPVLPDYRRRLTGLDIPAGDGPVVATIERLGSDGEPDGVTETVRARFVVGCDGARSAVRGFMGLGLHGDAANHAWGVMDVLAVTDFPDIRFKAVVHSANEGNLLVIPREGGYMFRLYIELDALADDERVASRNITVDRLIRDARRIFTPYSLDVKEVAWWSVYEIGQRMTERYDDLPSDAPAERTPRVFIAGDACHTHSPKAGQGMNVSMRDGFNLGWKLGAVLRGQSPPAILRTYSTERWAVARQLIDFDRELAKMFSAPPKTSADDTEGVDPAEFQRYFQQHGRFTAGTETRYSPSMIVGGDDHQALAAGFPIGKRFHSAPVVRLADGRPIELGHVADADGRWRLYLFADAGRPDHPDSQLAALCEFLATDDRSPVRRATPADADVDHVIDVRGVVRQHWHDLTLGSLPALLRPTKGRYGLVDQEKVFCPAPGRDIFERRGVSSDGAVVVVRPDQHVAHVLPLQRPDELAAFFANFLLTAS